MDKKEKLALSLPKEESKTPLVDALVATLKEKKDKLERELLPYREYHDKHVNDKKYIEARTKIKQISAELGPVCNELAAVVRTSGKNKSIKIESGEYSKD